VLGNDNAATAIGFPRRALGWFRARGVSVERVMTDNGSAYVSHAHAAACRELGLRHLRTRPCRPRTNGKAERFIQTLLRESAYGRIYGTSAERTAQLPRWLEHYNFKRPHGALSHKPPGSRLNTSVRNFS
jgi:transposase InsO family protein